MPDITKLQENLTRLGYHARYFPTAAEATAVLSEELAGQTVGMGGALTVKEMGLMDALRAKGAKLLTHWNGATMEEVATTPVYLSSVNGAAETGELVNIDGTGNRVASTIFGHEVLYLIFGVNKIEPTLEKAVWRAQNIAAPKNAQRLGRKTPCAVKGDKCYHCTALDRVCRAMVIHLGPTKAFQRVEAVIVGEDLGL